MRLETAPTVVRVKFKALRTSYLLHRAHVILGLAVVAMLCGYRSYSAIAQWGRTYPPQLAVALGFTHPKTPCASTFHYGILNNVLH